MQEARCPRAYAVISAMAAAAGKQNDGNDDQPKGAVVKQIAKTVIHNRSSKKSLEELWGAPLLSYYDEKGKMCKNFVEKGAESNFFCCKRDKSKIFLC